MWYAHITCHFVLPFSVWWWRDKSQCNSYTGKERPKNEKDQVTESCIERFFESVWSVKQSELPGAICHNRGEGGGHTEPHVNPLWQWPTCHKTLSCMKNGGQEKCLDRTLFGYQLYSQTEQINKLWNLQSRNTTTLFLWI